MREDLFKKFRGKKVSRDMTWKDRVYLPAVLKGMRVTLTHLFQKKVTIEYPEVKREYSTRFRGRHILKVDENHIIKCVACELCEISCPSSAIKIIAKKSDIPGREREPEIYEIDMLRCIFCGFCVEACPCDAIAMTDEKELGGMSRQELIYTKEMLLERK